MIHTMSQYNRSDGLSLHAAALHFVVIVLRAGLFKSSDLSQ